MRISIVSTFREGYRPALEECYARGFLRAGHQVQRVGSHHLFAGRRGLLGVARRALGEAAALRHIETTVLTGTPEVVVLVKAAEIPARLVAAWRAAGARVVNVFPDNPFDAMGATRRGGALQRQLQACDQVYVHDRFAAGQLRRLGVRADFLAFARDPELHDRSLVAGGSGSPVRIAFVGNPDPERIRFLRAVADLGLGLWGAWHWARLEPSDPLAGCVRGGELLGPEMTKVLGAASLSVNLLRPSQKTAHNMRTFESPACGTCTLSEASNGVLELMEDGREVVTFRTPAELRHRALELLENPTRRQDIAEAGWRRVEAETYEARARQVLERLR